MSVIFKYWWILLGCLILGAAGGVALSMATPRKFQASQGFLLRDEMSGPFLKPGRFESQEALKSAQETVQEIARNPQLLSTVLETVGPDSWFTGDHDYPSIEAVEDFQEEVWISAANGAELGKTEVIHLNVRACSKERAKKIVDLLAEGVERELRELRGLKAKSFQAEAKVAFEVAKKHHDDVTEQLKNMEASVGADLGELRALENPASGDSIIRRNLIQIHSDLLQQRSKLSYTEQQLLFFKNAVKNKDPSIAIPFDMLQTLPTIRELQLGLVKSKLKLSEAKSQFSGKYEAKKTKNEVEEIEKHIQEEMQVAYKTTQQIKKFIQERITSLEKEKKDVEDRLARLANLRTPYHNLIQENQIATTRLNETLKNMNWSNSLLYGSEKVDLLTRLENSQVRSRPVGLSRTTMLLGCTGCGLFVGIGIVMLLCAPAELTGTERTVRMSRQESSRPVVQRQPNQYV